MLISGLAFRRGPTTQGPKVDDSIALFGTQGPKVDDSIALFCFSPRYFPKQQHPHEHSCADHSELLDMPASST